MAEVEYNPYAYPIHEDPYPTYAALRAHAPVYRNEELDFWALSRHADVLAAFRDTESFPDYEIEPAGAVRVHSINVRGFAALPVKV